MVTPASKQHAAEDGQVRRRAEEPGVARDAAHAAGGWIVHDAAQHLRLGSFARPGERQAALRRSDARTEARRREEGRLLHPERIEDLLLGELVERLAADAPNDIAEQEEVDVAVHEALTRRSRRHFFDGKRNSGVRSRPRLTQIDVRSQA